MNYECTFRLHLCARVGWFFFLLPIHSLIGESDVFPPPHRCWTHVWDRHKFPISNRAQTDPFVLFCSRASRWKRTTRRQQDVRLADVCFRGAALLKHGVTVLYQRRHGLMGISILLSGGLRGGVRVCEADNSQRRLKDWSKSTFHQVCHKFPLAKILNLTYAGCVSACWLHSKTSTTGAR